MNKIMLTVLLTFICLSEVRARIISLSGAVLQENTFTLSASGSYMFTNQCSYDYNPTSIAASSPMIKVTGSDITINFQNIGVTNQDTSHVGWVGIEIGWSPQELLDDPTREQPKNIQLSHLSLYNFDCPVLIHAGVEGVTMSDCYFYKTLVGIGMFGTETSLCEDITLNNITVYGISGNYQSGLQAFKTRVENDFGYGVDYYMPLKPDPLNSDSVDVYTYYGLFIKHTNNLQIRSHEIRGIGYEQYDISSEGDGKRTEAVGVRIQHSRRINIDLLTIADTASEVKAVAMQLDDFVEVNIKNSDFSYSTSLLKAVGLEVLNDSLLEYSGSALTLQSVSAKLNSAGDIAIGFDLSNVRGAELIDVVSKYNQGATQAFGLYTSKMYTVDIHNSKFSENTATRQINDVATTKGIVAAGFYGQNVNSLQAYNVDYTSMQALNTAYGMFLKNSTSCQFFDCQFVGNVSSMMRSGEADAIRSQQDAQEISMHGPVVEATNTGAYGSFLDSCKYVKYERCLANSNVGHRSIGFSARNSNAVALWDCFASTQNATGTMFDSSLVTDITDPTALPINLVHKPLLFGDFTKSSVDMIQTTDLFLASAQNIRESQTAGSSPSYSDVISMLATNNLLQAAVARYRLWSVAIGVYVHNVTGFLLRNCTCVGQISLFDSAYGVCFSGRNNGHTIYNCNLSFNVGHRASLQNPVTGQPYAYSYNTATMKPFWNMLLQSQEPWSVVENTDLTVAATAVTYNPDGTQLAVGTAGNEVKVYDTSDWSLVTTLTGHTAPITSLSWRPDGAELASSTFTTTDNIKVWNTSTWIADQTLTHGSTGVNALAYSPGSTRLVSGSSDTSSNIKIWNTSDWSNNTETHGTGVNTIAWKNNTVRFATGSQDASDGIKIWKFTLGDWNVDQTLNSHTDAVTSLDWSSDDMQLVSGSADDTIKIWETSGWTVSQTISPALGNISTVRFKPDDSLLAVGYDNNLVQIYQTSDWSLDTTLSDFTDSVTSMDWVASGRYIAIASSDNLYRIYSTNIWKKADTTSEVGLYTGSGNYILQNSLSFVSLVSDSSVFVDLTGVKRPWISPIGPVGAGLVMGDLMIETAVSKNKIYGNLGNAGHVYGASLNKGYSITLDDNIIAGNNTNVHGLTAGVVDVTAHSPNLYMKNFFEGNKCSVYNNANYIIPFNPADTNTLALPVKKIMNGKFSNITNDGYENLIVEYSQEPEFYSYDYLATIPIHSDLTAYLTNNNCWN